MKKIVLIIIILLSSTMFYGQTEKQSLWKGIKGVRNCFTYLLYYEADANKKTDAAVIIFPGGSYHHLGRNHEGRKVAKWFANQGVAAFVVFYRTSGRGCHYPAMMQDYQRAMQLVSENADKYKINTNKIGTIGFSAGGHLVTMGAAFSSTNYLEPLGIKTDVSLRPNWIAPIYPVVSMQDSIAHQWSRSSLIGTKTPTQEQKDKFSMEMQIPNNMPPVFLQCSKDDPVVDYRNSIALDKALTEKNINHVFYLYQTGGHGYGMKDNEFATSSNWHEKLYNWLVSINIINK